VAQVVADDKRTAHAFAPFCVIQTPTYANLGNL
jgi:hypothetical protein